MSGWILALANLAVELLKVLRYSIAFAKMESGEIITTKIVLKL